MVHSDKLATLSKLAKLAIKMVEENWDSNEVKYVAVYWSILYKEK